jgi:hypothetical protein
MRERGAISPMKSRKAEFARKGLDMQRPSSPMFPERNLAFLHNLLGCLSADQFLLRTVSLVAVLLTALDASAPSDSSPLSSKRERRSFAVSEILDVDTVCSSNAGSLVI